jgi:hypothetical protein
VQNFVLGRAIGVSNEQKSDKGKFCTEVVSSEGSQHPARTGPNTLTVTRTTRDQAGV